MTNEEKAKELLGAPTQWTYNYWRFSEVTQKELRERRNLLKKMAEWKDQQFKEYLEKKKSDIEQGILHSNPFIDCDRWCGRADIINEIINELFGETEQDNLDREK